MKMAPRIRIQTGYRKPFLLLVLLVCSIAGGAQERSKTATGFFDLDNKIDTLHFSFAFDSVQGPVYHVRLVPGAGRERRFDIGVGFESMQITDCKKGCIETYQRKAGNEGYEEVTQYQYSAVYDDWIMKAQTTTADGERPKVYRTKVPTGIGGKEYAKPKKR